MQTLSTIASLQALLKQWRASGASIGFVPTMGNLHAGHLDLVKHAQQNCTRVVVSIFVNPMQFGPNEDFASYPRSVAEDEAHLSAAAVDVLFLPTSELLYPEGSQTRVLVDHLSDLHCGASRPGHFCGVATIVAKLFNIIQPDIAFFGEKDWQQLTIIRQMVQDLNFAVTIHSVPTVREHDGLAMSSRNSYLTPAQRLIAPVLYQTLCAAKTAVLEKQLPLSDIEHQAWTALKNAGFEPDYVTICKQHSLEAAQETDSELVILAAAKLGTPRLIDNIHFSRV